MVRSVTVVLILTAVACCICAASGQSRPQWVGRDAAYSAQAYDGGVSLGYVGGGNYGPGSSFVEGSGNAYDTGNGGNTNGNIGNNNNVGNNNYNGNNNRYGGSRDPDPTTNVRHPGNPGPITYIRPSGNPGPIPYPYPVPAAYYQPRPTF